MKSDIEVFKLCVEEPISVALQPPGYHIHGHDVAVKACWCIVEERIDIEFLASMLSNILRDLNHKPLWESLGKSGAMIEDMLVYIKRRLEAVYGERLCELEARWANRSIAMLLIDSNSNRLHIKTSQADQ